MRSSESLMRPMDRPLGLNPVVFSWRLTMIIGPTLIKLLLTTISFGGKFYHASFAYFIIL
jgi:hypothetical protein